MAVACRRRFESDYGLAVGRFPESDPAASEPQPVFVALATEADVQVKRFLHAGHPATLKILCAKRAVNVVRLAMIE